MPNTRSFGSKPGLRQTGKVQLSVFLLSAGEVPCILVFRVYGIG